MKINTHLLTAHGVDKKHIGKTFHEMMVIDNKFEIGQIVFLKTDLDQCPRMVTRLSIAPNVITYCLSLGSSESWHYDNEISEVKNYAEA